MDTLERARVTKRERDVLRLLGDRMTNAEIASLLFISVRTVESHVSSLLMKLGAENRRDLGRFRSAASLRGFPVPGTEMVGREEQLEAIDDLLNRFRLVTLTGVGGSGKTRLAIEIGKRQADQFADGAVFADLAQLSEPDLVVVALAQTMGLESGERSTDLAPREVELLGRIEDLSALVVLDNCEHLLDATARLAQLVLDHSQEVRVLVTSREAFGVPGEAIHVVPPLELPDPESPSREVESVRLFEARARAVRTELDLEGAHADAVADICRSLDGIPLAIELAAVQTSYLSPEDISARLGDRFKLLTGRHRTDPRQATLAATIDWSYELMSVDEQRLLGRLGVFAGWFTLPAAEEVCANAPLDRESVAGLLGSLVWKSMLTAEIEEDRARYRLLETLRVYALDKLDESGVTEATFELHCQWCIRLAEEAEPHLVRAERDTWLVRLESALPDFRAALSWAIENSRAEDASRLFVALWRYWHMRGDIAEGMKWANAVLGLGGVSPTLSAKALGAAGGLAYWAGEMERSRELYELGLALVRKHGSDAEIADALYNASFAYGFGGMTQPALDYLDEALSIYKRMDDRQGIAKSLWGWGACAYGGDMPTEARPRLEQALALYETLDDTFMLAWAHRMLGSTLLQLGELYAARPHLDAGLRLFHKAGDVSGIILHLRDYAQLAVDQDEGERASTLVGALAAVQDQSGLDLVEAFSQQISGLEELRTKLGDQHFDELAALGKEMSTEQAIDYATS